MGVRAGRDSKVCGLTSLADPAILGLFSLFVAVPVSVHSFAWVWCIIKMLVELWVYAIGLGCGVAVVHTNHTDCDEQ